jgi:glycosyltransferase involved in cell wall biosynthesis
MMRVGIDLTPLLPVETGVDRYLIQLVRGLDGIDRDTRYTLFVNAKDAARFAGLSANFTILPAGMHGRAGRLFVQQAVIPVLTQSRRLDVLHSPSFFMPWCRGRARHLLTVFDMTTFTQAACHTRFRRSRAFQSGIAASIRRAHLVAVPSSFVSKEILRLLPDVDPGKLKVTPLGVNAEFRPRAERSEPVPDRIAAFCPYILFVGTIEPRKNLTTLLEAYRMACARYGLQEYLLLVGRKGWNYASVDRLIEAPELRQRVRLFGYASPGDLVLLYQQARLFVYPSLEEGFGFPPLEAMACGIPTIASATSSLKENLSGAALLVPPDDVAALAGALAAALQQPGMRASLSEKGLARAKEFSWEATAAKTLDCYRELAAFP